MASQEKVLIVEDEPHALSGLAELVSGWGYRTETARDGLEALEKVSAWQPGIVVTDLKMPRMDGLQLLARLGETSEKVAVVMLTAQGSIEAAVEAMKNGAYDFIQKPVDPARLRAILTNASRQRETERELEVTRRKLREAGVLGSLVGASKKMQEIFALIERVAASNVSVLITGESGTGKELVARTLHDLSPRRSKPFVAVNCAAIPETLIESEIFGHEKGAFTGAIERRAGCFELAEDGTLLLDEIGEMPVGTQAKLLRVLEDRKLRRLGSKVESPVDVRVLAATNKDPEDAVADGHLRGDLYYRLNVFNIHMPPLREHKEDIPAIAEAMISDMNQKHQKRVTRHGQRDAGAADGARVAGQRARAAQHHRARGGSVRGRTDPVAASASGVRHAAGAAGQRAAAECDSAGSGRDGGRCGTDADLQDAGVDEQQQDAGGGDSGHQPEDPPQQAARVWQRRRRRGSGGRIG